MSPNGPVLPLLCLLSATITAKLLCIRFGVPRKPGRFVAIDGLRGYLALAVFISHTAVWYYYVRTGRWEDPPSRLYVHLGQSSVVFFFNITAFLFFSKLLDARQRRLDWTRLYLSRLFRLLPLYLVVVGVLFTIVIYLSDGELRVSPAKLAYSCFHWITFTVLGGPDINGVRDTSAIVAGVTWSLTYEWFFYAALPVLGLPLRVSTPKAYLWLSFIGIVGFCFFLRPFPMRLLAFGGGIAAAVVVRRPVFCRAAATAPATLLALGCIVLAVSHFDTAYALPPLVLLSVAFAIIAGGNTLFGALSTEYSRLLGDMSYSIYLLHGILLFGLFRLVLGLPVSTGLSASAHCWVALACTPVLIVIAFTTYRLIEIPGMRQLPHIESWLRTCWPRALAAAG